MSTELDAMLFSMQECQISPIVRSEIGFHILFCENIKLSKQVPFQKAALRIREPLIEHQRRNCQKTWLSHLQHGE